MTTPTQAQIEAEQDSDLNSVLLGFTNYIMNERVRAYNEGVNATIERCAQYHDEQEKLFRARAMEAMSEPCPLPDVSHAQDQVADWHKQSAAAIRALAAAEAMQEKP